jgi:hypothetical protein
MSFDQPPRNKMIAEPEAKKGYHFPSDGIHFAEFIEAATTEEATAIYNKIKRVMSSEAAPVEAPIVEVVPKEQSTAPSQEEEQNSS